MVVDGETLRRLAALGSATVHEAAGRVVPLDSALRPVCPGGSIAGIAITAKCAPGDNLAVHRAVATAPAGAVIVVAAEGAAGGFWGEILTAAAQARGVVGLVMDGGVRDTAALARRGFPAWTRHIAVSGTIKVTPGDVDVDVRIGDAIVHAGDVIVADDDGIVAIPVSAAAAVVRLGEERVEAEAELMKRIATGETTLDLLNLR